MPALIRIFVRLFAYSLDFGIMIGIFVLPQILLYMFTNGIPFKWFSQNYHIYFWVLGTISIPVWLYFIFMEASVKQAGFGKRIMGLKVCNEEGGRISIRLSFIRTAIRLLPWEITHLALLGIYFQPNPDINAGIWIADGMIVVYLLVFFYHKGRLTVHDFIAKTQVQSA